MGGGLPMPAKPAVKSQSLWALEGVRSLPIALQSDLVQTTFQSLGAEPRLTVTMVDQVRLDLFGWFVGLTVFLRGVWLTCRPRRHRLRFVGLTLIVAFLLPLVLPFNGLVGPPCNMAFYAGCWLIVYYLVAGLVKRVAKTVNNSYKLCPAASATVTAVCLLLAAPLAASADEPVVPVTVPPDAIIVPYDPAEVDPLGALNVGEDAKPDPDAPDAEKKPAKAFAVDKTNKILVPYDKYLELLRTVQGIGKPRPAPPAEYVLSGGEFTATLDGGQSLLVEGHWDVEVLVDHPVSVPLALVGGVLTKATLAPARGKAAEQPAAGDIGARSEPAQKPAAPQAGEPLLTIVVAGPGRRRLDLAMRFRIQRRGGWQIVEGRLPVPVAAALGLRVEKAKTEVVLSGGVDRGTVETKRDGELIETGVAADGALRVQWRAKAGAAPIDQSLSAAGAALLDVQESGLRMTWRFNLSFRGGQRESFTIDVPADYLVEKVTGNNVRGWRLEKADAGQKLEVTLLKAAQGSESFTVALSFRGAVGSGDLAQFSVPVLSVQAAAQQSGELTIRRSPLLQLRTESTAGVSRADNNAPPVDPNTADPNIDAEESPLGILPYQFYRFSMIPFSVKLSARPATPRVSAELQTVLKISARQRTLESRVRLQVADRPIFRLQIALPADLKLDQVSAPEPFQWVIGAEGEKRLLSLYFAGGQSKSFDVVLIGTLGEYGAVESVAAPKLEVVSADEQPGAIEQSGDIVVEADPALNVRAEKLEGCESELLSKVSGWLAPAQQQLARLAIRYRSPNFSAQFQLSPRKPIVHCTTVSNVRVTQRTVEETILLDFNIQDAGIRSLSFLLA